MITKKLISSLTAITLICQLVANSSICFAQDNPPAVTDEQPFPERGQQREIRVGETVHQYILPSPPHLQLTPPAILQNPPPAGRIYPLLRFEPAPFPGVIYNGELNAWLEAEREAAPEYLQVYSTAIQAEMTAWAYSELEQAHLQMATEQETSRLEINQLERQLDSAHRLRRRSMLRPILLTSVIVLTLGIAGTTTGYIVGRNHGN